MMNFRVTLMIWITVALVGLACKLPRALLGTQCFRSKDSECRSNLRAFATAQMAFKQETSRYGTTFAEIGFLPELNGRYLYTMDATRLAATFVPRGVNAWKVKWALIPARAEGDVAVGPQTAVCVGNIDQDEEVDVWSISTEVRRSRSGEEIPAGVPWHDRIDRERSKPEHRENVW